MKNIIQKLNEMKLFPLLCLLCFAFALTSCRIATTSSSINSMKMDNIYSEPRPDATKSTIPKLRQLNKKYLLENIQPKAQNGLWGFANDKGKFVIKPLFEQVTEFQEGVAMVKSSGAWGVINRNGLYVFTPQFDSIGSFKSGQAWTSKNNNKGIISIDGGTIFKPVFSLVKDFHGMYQVQVAETKEWGILNCHWQFVLEPQFSCETGQLLKNYYKVEKYGKFGIIDSAGKILIPPTYDQLKLLHQNEYLIARKNGSNDSCSIYEVFIDSIAFLKDIIVKSGADFTRVRLNDINYILLQDSALYTIKEYDDKIFSRGNYTYLTDNRLPFSFKSKWGEAVSGYDKDLFKKSVYWRDYLKDNILSLNQKSHASAAFSAILSESTPEKVQSSEFSEYFRIDSSFEMVDITGTFYSKDIRELAIQERIGGNIYTHEIIGATLNREVMCLNNDYLKKVVLRFDYERDISIRDIILNLTNGVRDNGEFLLKQVIRLTNGDYVLSCKVHFQDLVGTQEYFLPGRQVNVMGNNMTIGGGTFQHDVYSNEDLEYLIFIDGNTYNIKKKILLTTGNDVRILTSKYGGFYYWEKQDDDKRIIASHDSPLVLYNNTGQRVWKYIPSKGERIYTLGETPNDIFFAGSTTEAGYIGYENPLWIKFSKTGFKELERQNYEQKGRFLKIQSLSGNVAFEDENQRFVWLLSKELKNVGHNVNEKYEFKTAWEYWDGDTIGGVGVEDKYGKWYIHPLPNVEISDKCCMQVGNYFISKFSEDLACVGVKNKYGYVDKDGRIVIPLIYDAASKFSDGVAFVKKGDSYGVIDKQGNIVIPFKINETHTDFHDGFALVTIDNKVCFINKAGEKLPNRGITLNSAQRFSEGLSYQNEDRGRVINTKGETVFYTTKYEIVSPFSEGMASIKRCGDKGCKYGYVNTKGDIVIPLDYDYYETDFKNGRAIVLKNGKRLLIDKNNRVLRELSK